MKNFIYILILFFSTLSNAAVINDTKFEDQIKVSDKTLVLNGLGMRLATMLKVKAYAGALYLESKSSDPKAIVDSNGIKKIYMHFLRSIEKSKIDNGFYDAVKQNDLNPSVHEKSLKIISQVLPEEVKNGDVLYFTFFPDYIEVQFKDKVGKIEDKDFVKNLIKIWILNAPNEELSKGLLGL